MTDLTSLTVSPFEALRELSEMSNEGLIILKLPDGLLLYGNSRALELLKLDANKSYDIDSMLDRVHPDDRDYLKREIAQVIALHFKSDAEFRLNTHNAPDIFVCCNAYLVLGQNYLVLSLKDITKAKEHEDYLVEFGTKKNTMLETITHQMKGALLLMQHLSTAAEKTVVKPNNDLSSLLNLLRENSKYCIQVIDGLIGDEQRKAPDVFIKKARINVVEKVKFIFNHSAPSMYLKVDEFKLLQVLNNLASNAIKFTRSDGLIEISITEDGRGMYFNVADDGIGIPASMQPFIFHPFEIAGRPGLKGEKSVGHGLSISHQLVAAMGGKIWFESEENGGTTFHILLPPS